MPLLLALPLALLVFGALILLLLPLSLWQRFRTGSARRQARPWLQRLNLWLNLISLLLFALSAGVMAFWWPGVPQWALGGWALGVALGAVGYALTRFEVTSTTLFYTPNAWLVLALTVLVIVRIGAGLHQGWQVSVAGQAWPDTGWMSHAGLLGMAALLLGYSGMYAVLLARRVSRFARYRGYDRSPR
jgi:hypothetical protein